MRFRVNAHLKRDPAMIKWGVEFLRLVAMEGHQSVAVGASVDEVTTQLQVASIQASAESASGADLQKEVCSVCKSIYDVTTTGNGLYDGTLPLLARVVATLDRAAGEGETKDQRRASSIGAVWANSPPEPGPGSGPGLGPLSGSGSGPSQGGGALRQLLRRLRGAHGAACSSKQLFHEAVAAYLAACPPFVEEAIKAARLQGNWQLALTISGRHYRPGTGDPTGGGPSLVGEALSPTRIAQEIVADFRASLEQSEADGGSNGFFVSSSFGSGGGSSGEGSAAEAEGGGGVSGAAGVGYGGSGAEDKAMEAARISLDYCDDAESAVAILTLSRR